MTIKIIRSKEEFIAAFTEALFDQAKYAVEELDQKADEAGMDDPDLSLLVLAKLTAALASYTSYMSAGLYLASGQEALAAGVIKALETDLCAALQAGNALAKVKAKEINEQFKQAETAAEELLKKVMKKWH